MVAIELAVYKHMTRALEEPFSCHRRIQDVGGCVVVAKSLASG
jgi:hypothetical protein